MDGQQISFMGAPPLVSQEIDIDALLKVLEHWDGESDPRPWMEGAAALIRFLTKDNG